VLEDFNVLYCTVVYAGAEMGFFRFAGLAFYNRLISRADIILFYSYKAFLKTSSTLMRFVYLGLFVALNLENTNHILPTTGTKGVVGNEQRQFLLLVGGARPKASLPSPLRERDMENSRASRVDESDRDEGSAGALSSCERAVLG